MLTPEEQADLDFINEMATTNPSNLTDEDWDLAEKLEKKAKEATGRKSPGEIKARGEEAYKQMMDDIDTEYDKAYVEDNFGWIKNNPTANFGMSLIAPSSVESIDAGKTPSFGDLGIDLGLAVAGLAATPERIALTGGKALPKLGRLLAPSASRLKNIAVGAVEQGAVAGAGEGALSAQHDRDYSLTAPLVGTVAGGAIGGTATTSMAKKLLDAGYPQEEIADVMRKLGTTEKGTLNALGKGGVGDLDQLGVTDVKIPVEVNDVLQPMKEWDTYKAYKSIGHDAALSPVRKSMIEVKRLPNLSLKSKEKTLAELQELEDTFYEKLIKSDESTRQFAEDLLGGDKRAHAIDLGVDVDKLDAMFRQPATNIPLAGYVKDIEETITNPEIRRKIIADVAKESGEGKALKGYLDKGKYEKILEETPDVIETGTILGTVKNVAESAPHSIKTARDVLKAPTTAAERAKDNKVKPEKEKPKYTNRSGYNSDGDMFYGQRGYITYDDLWKDADEMKKKKNR